MDRSKMVNNVITLILAAAICIGFIVLIGYELDRSPTTVYQKQISERL
jgi:ascorbate-specific PTS system EIIC-type component UlaA